MVSCGYNPGESGLSLDAGLSELSKSQPSPFSFPETSYQSLLQLPLTWFLCLCSLDSFVEHNRFPHISIKYLHPRLANRSSNNLPLILYLYQRQFLRPSSVIRRMCISPDPHAKFQQPTDCEVLDTGVMPGRLSSSELFL